MISEYEEFLDNKTITIDYNMLGDEYSLNSAFSNAINKLYYEFFNTYDSISNGESIDCDPINQTCGYVLYYDSVPLLEKTFAYNYQGIELDSNSNEIGVNGHLAISYELSDDSGEVTVTSLDPNVCIIDNNDIVGISPGVCTIKYANNKYENYKHVFVGIDDYLNTINDALNYLPDTIELNLDQFIEMEEMDYEYESLYYFSIINQLEDIIKNHIYTNEKLNVYANISMETLPYGYVNVSFGTFYNFYKEGISYYENLDESDVVTINVVFNGLSEEFVDLANTIKETISNKYELSLLQYMKYRFDINNGVNGKSLLDYSSFINDLNNICDDCTYQFIGGYGDDNPDEPVQGGTLLISKDGDAIACVDTEVRVDISVTQSANEVLTEEEYINRVVEEIKNAYKEAKRLSLTFRLTNNDDVEVVVEKGFNAHTYKPEYTFIIDNDLKFTTSVETKVTGTKVYDAYVTGVNVDKTTINIKVDESATVTATVTPDNAKNKNVIWTSNNPGIISVTNGVIKGLSAGTGTVTVKTEEGDFTKVITVKVSEKPVAPPTDPTTPPKVTIGDVNRDEKINIADLIKLRKFVAGIDTLGTEEQKNADINQDGKINIVDIVKLRKHLAGLEEL